MSRPIFTPEFRARVEKVARENPDLTGAALAARFSVTHARMNELLRELGLARKRGIENLSLIGGQQASHLKRAIRKHRAVSKAGDEP